MKDPEHGDSRILVAFDGMDVPMATARGALLHHHTAGGKANDLIDEAGASVLSTIYADQIEAAETASGRKPKRFADPKIKDIPNTVYNRVMKYHGLADWVTVHGTNSYKSLQQSAAAATDGPTDLKVIAISVTTDIKESQCRKIYGMSVKRKVVQIVNRAKAAGMHGIVCSPQEVALVRKMWPAAIIIVPGVRSPGEDTHDQQRVGTPAQAILDGADYIVCGREVINGGVPAAKRINSDTKEAWHQRQAA